MYKRVLVPLDGSPLAEGVLPFIVDIAGPLDLEIHLVRVVQPKPPEVVEGSRHVILEDVEGRMREADDYLRSVATELAAKGVRVSTETRRGEPVTEIVAAAQQCGADLIAMTTHGRSGLGRLLFGSVAEAVLRQAEIPVFLMRLGRQHAPAQAGRGALR
jgi:nucleotide-binding universal stress UspA family protein